MLTIILNTNYLRYKDDNLHRKCSSVPGGKAICYFLDSNPLPLCNVPLACFDIKNAIVTGDQYNYFNNAMDLVKIYHKDVQKCMIYPVPKLFIDMLETLTEIDMHLPKICYANAFINLLPHPDKLREEFNPTIIIYSEEIVQGGLLSDESDNL